MYFTAFAAELIGQPEIQRGQDPEETFTGNQNEQEFTGNQNDQDSVSSDSAESVNNLTPQQRIVTDPPRTSSYFTQGVSLLQGMARRRSNTAISRSEPRISVNTNDNQPDSRPNRDQRGSVNITNDQTNGQFDSTRNRTPPYNENNSLSAIHQSNSNETNSTSFSDRKLFDHNDNVTERNRHRRPRNSNPNNF